MTENCVFCRIVEGTEPASIVCENELAMSFVDQRQFNAGHALVIPRRHFSDVRELDEPTGAALMAMVSRVARAVGQAFPNQGLSLWHSIGEAGHQEVPHLHIHVHPRLIGDGMLAVYPHAPPMPDIVTRDQYAGMLRAMLADHKH